MTKRLHCRKFDHEAALRRFETEKITYTAIAKELGVTVSAVHLAINNLRPVTERKYRTSGAWKRLQREVVALAKEGKDRNEIAVLVDTYPYKVTQICRENGVELRRKGSVYSPDVWRLFFDEGLSRKDTAARLGVKATAIEYALNREDVISRTLAEDSRRRAARDALRREASRKRAALNRDLRIKAVDMTEAVL